MNERIKLTTFELEIYNTLCHVGSVCGSNYVALSRMLKNAGKSDKTVEFAIRVLESFLKLSKMPGLNLRTCVTRGGCVVLAERYGNASE